MPETATETNRLADVLENPNVNSGILAATNLRFRIGRDAVMKAVADLPNDQRDDILWAWGYCQTKNLSTGQFGELLQQKNGHPYSDDSVYAALTGRREGGAVVNFCEAVRALRLRLEENRPRATVKFIETSLSRGIDRTCRSAFEKQRLTFILGESQIGKSMAIDHYAQQHNHGETILVRMPTKGSLRDFKVELAIQCGISTKIKVGDLNRRIMECFDSRTLLIVDECHQCLKYERNFLTLDFIREIHDRRHCGTVLVGTLDMGNELRNGKALPELWKRRYRPLRLPRIPCQADLNEFAKAFGLGPADLRQHTFEVDTVNDQGEEITLKLSGTPAAIQQNVIDHEGLGPWISLLQDAQETARERGKQISWNWVIFAFHQAQQLER